MRAVIDFETRSTVDIAKSGAEKYAEHSTTSVLCLAYCFDDGPVRVWTPHTSRMPDDLLRHVARNGVVVAHNAAFELSIWRMLRSRDQRWPELRPEQMSCTMARAYAMALPGSLDGAIDALGLPVKKSADGRRVMLKMAKPRRIAGAAFDAPPQWHDGDDDYSALIEYCRQDVEAERALDKYLPELSDAERALWVLDRRINDRGVAIDVVTTRIAARVVQHEQRRLDDTLSALTAGAVPSARAVAKLGDWLSANGCDAPDLTKSTVADLATRDYPAHVSQALAIRREASMSSTSKLAAMLNSACADGRARGLFQFHGAATGRWAGRRIQTQNMPRTPGTFDSAAAEQILAWLLGMSVDDAADAIAQRHGSAMQGISWLLRSLLVPANGSEFVCADLANIEGRVLAWLAGERWKVQAFRDYDAGVGPDIYKLAYARAFGLHTDAVSKDQRQLGKVMELALGYQGGAGAFESMAKNYNVHVVADRSKAPAGASAVLLPADVDDIKNKWRHAHGATVRLWYALNDAAVYAVRNVGEVAHGGEHIAFRSDGDWLKCRLPSGRLLYYAQPTIGINGFGRDAVEYSGVNGYTREWERAHLYGGMLAENVTQAVARDVLALSFPRVERAGYRIVMHVHDEILTETKRGAGSVDELAALMTSGETWSDGLPLAADGWRGDRYRK